MDTWFGTTVDVATLINATRFTTIAKAVSVAGKGDAEPDRTVTRPRTVTFVLHSCLRVRQPCLRLRPRLTRLRSPRFRPLLPRQPLRCRRLCHEA